MAFFLQLIALTTVGTAAWNPSQEPNMNGDYVLSKTPGAPAGKDFPTNYKDYPGGLEYFDVYHGPITTTYGQVWWTSTSNDLPKEFVERFRGKAIAVIGFEADQVRKGAGPNGEDVSVPITMAYNHHHDTAVVGSGTTLEKIDMHHPDVKKAGRKYIRLDHGKVWLPREHTPSKKGLPTSAMFSDGNGGEYRKSYHVYAPPFAQIVESPERFAGSPMQIDTWNRANMSITGAPHFVPGPYPKLNLAPTTGPDALYSGLLECPLTTRIQKIFNPGSEGFNDSVKAELFQCSKGSSNTCDQAVNTTEACFAAASTLGLGNVSTRVVDDPDTPPGCSLTKSSTGGASTGGDDFQLTFNKNFGSKACCGATTVAGEKHSLVKLSMNVSTSVVTITMTGPSTVWFGVGFDATLMVDKPYTIVVDGKGAVTERKLDNHAPGTPLATSIKVLSNTVSNGARTVVLTRPAQGLSKDHFTFHPHTLSIDFINAIGSGPELAYHKQSTADTIQLWPSGDSSPVCVCAQLALPFGQASGYIKYLPTGEKIGFKANRCPPKPREDLLANRNPTCDIRTYTGGLMTCHHGWTLLDADQDIPWADQPLVYHKKFRIYYQEYNASYHKQLQRHDWGIAADGDHAEYDVPQCAAGTPTAECTHRIQGTWQALPPAKTEEEKLYLIAVHHHCHAPTCLRVEVWNNDTGKLICAQEPIYGGTHKIDRAKFDETNYIATPPCLWGNPAHGLERPPMMSGVTVQVVSITNNTYGHHGEMALPECSLVHGPLPY